MSPLKLRMAFEPKICQLTFEVKLKVTSAFDVLTVFEKFVELKKQHVWPLRVDSKVSHAILVRIC